MSEINHIKNSDEPEENGERRIVQFSEHYSGPIARPKDLEKYEQILPGAADRIFTMAEKEQESRQRLTRWDMLLFHSGRLLSLFFAFIIAVSVIGGGIFLLYNDKEVGGMTALIGGVASLVGLFIYKEQSKNRNESEED